MVFFLAGNWPGKAQSGLAQKAKFGLEIELSSLAVLPPIKSQPT